MSFKSRWVMRSIGEVEPWETLSAYSRAQAESFQLSRPVRRVYDLEIVRYLARRLMQRYRAFKG